MIFIKLISCWSFYVHLCCIGAFKADLFRYCVLLIRGGVYADMDVLLQTNLDDAIANDIGFMTPIDEVRFTRDLCRHNL